MVELAALFGPDPMLSLGSLLVRWSAASGSAGIIGARTGGVAAVGGGGVGTTGDEGGLDSFGSDATLQIVCSWAGTAETRKKATVLGSHSETMVRSLTYE